ncbi:hypothetical protein MTQ01_21115 [Streptomyces sp. XM4193]|uniref:S16 family serine protease n=1 Tax=Streptomyces sp. XM4193 TaxID=2929782 RepID=UPI001FFB1BD4|nr:S16 family serine protease [Streptomyces sp. XM4193]MCK1798481.1 hypothetical protein [Streptomyces sp. XM4193]
MMSRLSSRRGPLLAACAVPIVALVAVAALAPLPYVVAQPGVTADVLGEHEGKRVISVQADGGEVRSADGRLLMTTIAATTADTELRLTDVVRGWLDDDRAVMPKEAVYPRGDSVEKIRKHNTEQMNKSQSAAVQAALRQLRLSADEVEVDLALEDIGGPSAGLLFALGIVELLDGDGRGGDLTGGRTVAGTGTITASGRVGPVGGVPLKTLAAKRDGASVFLVPADECAAAEAAAPDGLRLVPVETLRGAVDSLKALEDGGDVPSC